MKRPLLSLALFAGWLLLADSASPGRMLTGLLLALWLPRLAGPPPAGARGSWRGLPRRFALAGWLAAVVLVDILRANLDVARRILGDMRALRPGWARVPLRLTDPRAAGLLAGIVTMTPGTLSVELSEDGGALLVHALHLPDAQALVDEIRTRYEAPLLMLFDDPGRPA